MMDGEQTAAPESPSAEASYAQVVADAEAIELDPAAPPASEASPAAATAPAPDPAPAPAADAPASPAATAESSAPPAETATDSPPAEPSWTFKVDGREVTLKGAREDGDNIVVPKTVWHQELKNFLADRGAVAQRERELTRQYQAELQQARQQQSAEQTIAGTVMQELDRIMGLPEDESYLAWEKMRTGYAERKAAAERDFYRAQAEGLGQQQTSQQEQAVIAQLDQFLDGQLKTYASQAVDAVKDQLAGLDEGERREFEARLYTLLREDAEAGRIFVQGHELIPGTRIPKPVPQFQRVAAVVDREVQVVRRSLERLQAERKRAAELERAAAKNAAEEARRKGVAAPPPVSPKGTDPEPRKATAPQSWDDVLKEIDDL